MRQKSTENHINRYLVRQDKTSSYFSERPKDDLEIIVVIPAYKEDDIAITIDSLYECDGVLGSIEIIVFVNGSEKDSLETRNINLKCIETIKKLQGKYVRNDIKILLFDNISLPEKKSGVGAARKNLMDEAALRFNSIQKRDGIIANLDADCKVSRNYFQSIDSFFKNNRTLGAASIYYEHRFLDPILEEAIIQYELHLRYFIGMQRIMGLPFAFHTIGSAMVCRVKDYARVGGMNTRKAGEDFYFLQKFIKIEECGEIKDAVVYPSDRISDRVPFGTGKAVGDKIGGKANHTYNPKSFLILKHLLKFLEYMYQKESLPKEDFNIELISFLDSISFVSKLKEIKNHTKNYISFEKRFYQYFDAFIFMKYLHYMRDHVNKDVELNLALEEYFGLIDVDLQSNIKDNLSLLRKYDRNAN